MARPVKNRRVCALPKYTAFAPIQKGNQQKGPQRGETVVLTVDEYEALRLIDMEGFSQIECSEYMQVARTTVQHIYMSARKKLTSALVNGKPLVIQGGDYCLCDGNHQGNGPHGLCGRCHRCCSNNAVKHIG